jgi:16S rRNA (adenine1518-N6/adenine1519-N6)-dimethyltransferase
MNKNIIHKPRKSLGQNFLNDPNVIRRIIAACQLQPEETVFEIGPGFGALTKEIAPAVRCFYAVEKDKDLYDYLYKNISFLNTTFYHQDFLAFDFSKLTKPVKIIGNLPYNISSPIMERLIHHREYISEVFITVQLEFGKRLVAAPGSKDYSALSCVIQYYAEPKILFKIKNTCFSPAPKVESCFVNIHFKQTPNPQTIDEKIFLRLIKGAFQQRRKQLQNALAAFMPKADIKQLFEKLSLNPQARAENLSVNDYVKISNALAGK